MLSPNTHRVWKNHKYIRKEGNRYIYPEDLKRMQRSRDGKLVRTITDANGNRIQVRGAAATNTIVNRSNRYDRSSGERMSPSEYRTRQQDGSLDRMRGQTIQEAAKKQGQYSLNMMRQEKAAQQVQRPIPKQTMVSTPANLAKRSATTSSSQNISTAAKQAMERAGYTGPVKRPQNQNVKSVQKTTETKETKTPTSDTKKTTSTLSATNNEDGKKTTTKKSTSTSSGSSRSTGSSSSGSSSGSSSRSSSSGSSVSKSSGDSRGTVSKATGSGYTKAGSGGLASRLSRSQSKSSGSGSASASSTTSESDAKTEEANKLADEILDGNKDVEDLSKSELKTLSSKLEDVLDLTKIKTSAKGKGKLKVKDSEDFVKMGLSILSKFKK